jgi:hypothetical protein
MGVSCKKRTSDPMAIYKKQYFKKENFDQTDAYACVLGYMRSVRKFGNNIDKLPII